MWIYMAASYFATCAVLLRCFHSRIWFLFKTSKPVILHWAFSGVLYSVLLTASAFLLKNQQNLLSNTNRIDLPSSAPGGHSWWTVISDRFGYSFIIVATPEKPVAAFIALATFSASFLSLCTPYTYLWQPFVPGIILGAISTITLYMLLSFLRLTSTGRKNF